MDFRGLWNPRVGEFCIALFYQGICLGSSCWDRYFTNHYHIQAFQARISVRKLLKVLGIIWRRPVRIDRIAPAP